MTQKKNEVVTQDGKINDLTNQSATDWVANKVREFISKGELFLPPNYSAENAMKQAYLILQSTVDKDKNPALDVCTKQSIANALLDMTVQGLNPGKKQCYFIVYGNKLVCQRSYFGSMSVAKVVNPKIGEFTYAVVYEGDEFEYGIEKGKKTVLKHTQKIDNVDKKKIKAAYCIMLDKEGEPMRTEVMTIAEIEQSWTQSKMNSKKEDGTHKKFTPDMALKTVINKTCKIIINSSDDSTLLNEAAKRNEDLADRITVATEIELQANTGETLTIESEKGQDGVNKGKTGTKQPESETEPDKSGTEGPIEPFELCIEQRACPKYLENVKDCPKVKAGVAFDIHHCVDWQKKLERILCPELDGKEVTMAKCDKCDMKKGCPAHDDGEGK